MSQIRIISGQYVTNSVLTCRNKINHSTDTNCRPGMGKMLKAKSQPLQHNNPPLIPIAKLLRLFAFCQETCLLASEEVTKLSFPAIHCHQSQAYGTHFKNIAHRCALNALIINRKALTKQTLFNELCTHQQSLQLARLFLILI